MSVSPRSSPTSNGWQRVCQPAAADGCTQTGHPNETQAGHQQSGQGGGAQETAARRPYVQQLRHATCTELPHARFKEQKGSQGDSRRETGLLTPSPTPDVLTCTRRALPELRQAA